MTVAERTYDILSQSPDITAKLAGGVEGIYKGRSPDAGSYPVLVYTAISHVPHQWGDNQVRATRTTIRITLVTTDGAYQQLAASVYQAMTAAGFMWQSSTDERDGTFAYYVMHFTYAEEVG